MKTQTNQWEAKDFLPAVSFRPDPALAEALAAAANRCRSSNKTALVSSLLESALSQASGSEEQQARILRMLQDRDRHAETHSWQIEDIAEQLGELATALDVWSEFDERMVQLLEQLQWLSRIRGEVAAAMAVLLCTDKQTPMDEEQARQIVIRIFPSTAAENS